MSTRWSESLENIDDLISCMGSLETEDVIYLEEYLIGNTSPASGSPSNWSLTREDTDINLSESTTANITDGSSGSDLAGLPAEQVHIPGDPSVPPHLLRVSNDATSERTAPVRATRGVTSAKFVSYESLPASKEKRFMCELCGLRLATRESRRRHILGKHIKQRTNLCNVCGKSFIFKFALRAHEAVHSDTPRFTCVCGSTFTLRASYNDHIRRIHRAASDIKYPCELCFKSFRDRHTLRLHLNSVHKPKTIPCMQSGCGKVFSTISLMRAHYRYHLKQRFTCDVCDQSFSTESYMYKHRLTHSGIRQYVCVDCSRTYMSASHLNNHRRITHSSVRPFQCSICGKCYKTRDQLTFHESSHRGEKPYQCNVCGYSTSYRNTYYAHRKKHTLAASDSEAKELQQKSSVSVSQSSENCKAAGTLKDKKKTLVKCSSKSKYKSRIDDVSNQQKAIKTTYVQVFSCDSKYPSTLNTLVRGGRKKESVSSCQKSEAALNITCVVSSQSEGSGLFCQQVPALYKSSSNNAIVQCSSDNRVREPVCHGASTSSHQTYLSFPENKSDVFQSDIISGKQSESLRLLSENSLESETEKDESCIILSDSGRCAMPTCDSNEDSLLLFRLDHNSYVGVCSQHTNDQSAVLQKYEHPVKQLTSVDLSVPLLQNIVLQPEYVSKTLGISLISANNTSSSTKAEEATISLTQDKQPRLESQMTMVPIHNDKFEAIPSENPTHQPASEVVAETKSEKSAANLVTKLIKGQSPINIALEVSRGEPATAAVGMEVEANRDQVGNDTLFQSHQMGGNAVVPSAGEVCLPQEFSEVMGLDSGVASLSGHIVDDSFNLAQMEIVCHLCDEQFLCMDDCVTHLQYSHG